MSVKFHGDHKTHKVGANLATVMEILLDLEKCCLPSILVDMLK